MSDAFYLLSLHHGCLFLSTLPARGATNKLLAYEDTGLISIHAPREGSDLFLGDVLGGQKISIHAPREGSDARGALTSCIKNCHFYPRSPRGERRTGARSRAEWFHFYPRSPRGERPGRPRLPASVWNFYPRSPRGERQGRFDFYHPMLAFLSTLPARGATAVRRDRAPVPGISIHAPREGSDPSNSAARAHPVISIHAPREGSD